jgi:hypothetical protein
MGENERACHGDRYIINRSEDSTFAEDLDQDVLEIITVLQLIGKEKI